jgi:hypothetical protein
MEGGDDDHDKPGSGHRITSILKMLEEEIMARAK